MCSHKPPRVIQTKCVFLISAPEEPGNFVLIKTPQWFRDDGAHACTGSAGGWRVLGSVSAPPLRRPASPARNQGRVCHYKSCCFCRVDKASALERRLRWHTDEKHSLCTSGNISTIISMKWGRQIFFFTETQFSIAPLPLHWCSEW